MTTATAARPLEITLIDFRSKEIDIVSSREYQCWMHDYKTVRILHRGQLPGQTVENVVKQHPDWVCIGVASFPYADEF
jgi:hypothetical protein